MTTEEFDRKLTDKELEEQLSNPGINVMSGIIEHGDYVKCTGKCGKILPVTKEYFHKSNYCKSGFRTKCKECRKPDSKLYADKNDSKIKEYKKQYNSKTKNKLKAFAYHKQYRIDNKEDLGEKNKTRVRNPKTMLKRNEYLKNRYHTSIHNRLVISSRNRINKVLKGKSKADTTMKLFGSDIKTVKEYIENQFQPGMSWDNKNEWHLDHSIPCSWFDLEDTEQQKLCFHYTNLQPLWAVDNLSKGNKKLFFYKGAE